MGWIAFASVMMMVVGVFQAIAGFVGLFKDEYYLVASKDLVLSVNYTAWGWIHLGIGTLLVLGGLSLLSGRTFGKVIGVLVATLSAIANLAFLAAYPVWAVTIIAIDVIIIYAITVHGREIEA
ncbi:MAG TPA: hypothetical protein VFJ85_07895 [Acidimicrobiales bacterium]|nr:hypothetical protein [Acidimicrobiales bacterium]